MEKYKIETGGPAFPIPGSGMFHGMDLRDYFAAKALQGFLAGYQTKGFSITPDMQDAISGGMYSMADAMLKARKSGQC